MIREATVEDIIHLLPLVKAFAADYGMEAELDARSVSQTLSRTVSDGLCIVHEGRDGIEGLVAGMASPNMWNYNKKQVDEIIFYVKPENRNTSVGALLLKVYKDKIETSCYISTLKLMSNSPDLSKYYQSLGYEEIERSFMKIHGG